MNAERLAELTQRAEQATALATDITALGKADPRGFDAEFTFRKRGTNSIGEYLSHDMLIEVLERGRRALIADKEAELEKLLGGESQDVPQPFIVPQWSPAKPLEATCVPCAPHVSTADPFPQPQPIAEISCAP